MDIPPNYAQANIFLPTNGYPNVPEITMGVSLQGYSGTLTAAATAMLAACALRLKPLVTSNTVFARLRLKSGPNDTGAFADVAGVVTGTSGGTTVLPQVAALIKKNTGHGGRQGAGRTYLPGINTASTTAGGSLSGTGPAVISAAFESWRTDMEALNLPLVLLHADDSATPFPIISFTCETLLATQRRRLR